MSLLKNIQDQIHTAGQNVKNNVNSVVSDIKNAGQNVTQEAANIAVKAALTPLLPIRSAISNTLVKKGVKPNNDILELVKQFYVNVIPKANFEGQVTSMHADAASVDWSKAVDVATKVVPLIISFIKGVAKKKEDGQALTSDEQLVLSSVAGIPIVQTPVTGAGSTGEPFEIFGFNGWVVIGVVGVIGIITYVYLNKKKTKKD